MERCPICGKEFERIRKNQPTCGDEECRVTWRKNYCQNYMRERREYHRAYNRKWMREYRAREKNKAVAREIQGEGYAERQKQKTLAMAGKVEL